MTIIPGNTESVGGRIAQGAEDIASILYGPRQPELISNHLEFLADVFEATANRVPDKVALIFESQQLTYAELDALAERLAFALQVHCDAKPGTVVCLFMPRGIDLLVAQLAIAKTGSAWLPLEFDCTPLARVFECMRDSEAVGCISINSFEELSSKRRVDLDDPVFNGTASKWMVFEQLSQCSQTLVLESPSRTKLRMSVSEENAAEDFPAYLIYTSGSTGKPKGIVIKQRSICHFLRSENAVLQVVQDDIVAQHFSVAFDMSFEEIWIAYLVGASLWVAPKYLCGDPEGLSEALISANVTVLHIVPTALAMFPRDVPTVRIINLGGEMCPESLVERYHTRSCPMSSPHAPATISGVSPASSRIPISTITSAPVTASSVYPSAELEERRMFNTYGPSEATVSATLERLQLGQAITIGTPLPNYNICIVDPTTNAVVPQGEQGELCIFGIGLADGYKGRSDLTQAKFVTNINNDTLKGVRVYKTGDLAKISSDGKLYCLGRIDDQVKIRGYRVELGEIETVISNLHGIGAAAVLLQKIDGIDQLVAYFVLANSCDKSDNQVLTDITPQAFRKALTVRLPSYMVPSRFVGLQDMPRLASGKIDRHALRAIDLKQFQSAIEASMESTSDDSSVVSDGDDYDSYRKILVSMENGTVATTPKSALFRILRQLFPNQPIRSEDDIFDDLGAHSLFVSELVSTLRKYPSFAGLSVQSIYSARQIGKIREVLDELAQSHMETLTKGTSSSLLLNQLDRRTLTRTCLMGLIRRLLCGSAQLVMIAFILFFKVGMWLVPYFVYRWTGQTAASLGLAIATYLAAQLALLIVAILATRLLLCDAREGNYPLYGFFYFRFWLTERLNELAPVRLLGGTPWFAWYYSLMGCRIGRDCHIGNNSVIRIPQLVQIGNDCSIGSAVTFNNAMVDSGDIFRIGEIKIGDGVVIGATSVINDQVTMEECSELGPMSTLQSQCVVPKFAVFDGSPSRFLRVRDPFAEVASFPASAKTKVGCCWSIFKMTNYVITAVIISVAFFLVVFPGIIVVDAIEVRLHQAGTHWKITIMLEFLALAIPISVILITGAFVLTSIVRRLIMRPVTPGVYSLSSWTYYRKWANMQLQEQALDILFGLFASVYSQFWFRAIGAKVGARTEISNATLSTPGLVEFGDESFGADAVVVGDEDVRFSVVTINSVKIGRRTFLGNSAYIPDGTILPNDVLIGVLSRPPKNELLKPGQTWIGSPAILVPKRAVDGQNFPKHLTFYPSRLRLLSRALVELIRIVLPLAVLVAGAYNIIFLISPLQNPLEIVGGLIALSSAFGFACFVLVFIAKWVLIGRYRPSNYPMWTAPVWMSEMVTSLYYQMAVLNFLNAFKGTPFLPWFLWSLGCNIGRNVFLDTTEVTEFDCVTIGDDAILNFGSAPQTHLFEDRVMKIGKVHIGKQCCVSAKSIILYDAVLENGVRLGSLSLIMKGERLPAYSSWIGSPAQRWEERSTSSSAGKHNIIDMDDKA